MKEKERHVCVLASYSMEADVLSISITTAQNKTGNANLPATTKRLVSVDEFSSCVTQIYM